MPRRKRATRNNRTNSVISVSSDINSTVTSIQDPTSSTLDLSETNANNFYTELERKMEAEMARIKQETAAAIENLEMEYQMIMLGIPKNIQNKTVDLNDERLVEAWEVFTSNRDKRDSSSSEHSISSPVAPTTVKKRRSRSVKEVSFVKPEPPTGLRRTTRIRSSSVDAYKTPKNKVRLSALQTASKYTVSKTAKKVEDSGINLKRVMRPDEEAISTGGSPLFVNPGISSLTPHVNIPLPGGVVLNIEPKRPRGRLEVPELDKHTKMQIKILCEQLKNIADH